MSANSGAGSLNGSLQSWIRQAGYLTSKLILPLALMTLLAPALHAREPAGFEEVQTIPSEGRAHLDPGEKWDYGHYPPTSGPHDPVPVRPGFYRKPQAPEKLVHSLEHGNRHLLRKPGRAGFTAAEKVGSEIYRQMGRSNCHTTARYGKGGNPDRLDKVVASRPVRPGQGFGVYGRLSRQGPRTWPERDVAKQGGRAETWCLYPETAVKFRGHTT